MHTVPASDQNTAELKTMSEAECWRRLSAHDLGRLAVIVEGQPLIFPVNYAVCNGVIAIRSAPGTKLTYAPGAKIGFEIDSRDPESGSGWSVLVQGRGVDATTALNEVSWNARDAAPHPAAPGTKAYRIAIEVQKITGRKFGPTRFAGYETL